MDISFLENKPFNITKYGLTAEQKDKTIEDLKKAIHNREGCQLERMNIYYIDEHGKKRYPNDDIKLSRLKAIIYEKTEDNNKLLHLEFKTGEQIKEDMKKRVKEVKYHSTPSYPSNLSELSELPDIPEYVDESETPVEEELKVILERINYHLSIKTDIIILGDDTINVVYNYIKDKKYYNIHDSLIFFKLLKKSLNSLGYVYLGDNFKFHKLGKPSLDWGTAFSSHNIILAYLWLIKNIDNLSSIGIDAIALEFMGMQTALGRTHFNLLNTQLRPIDNFITSTNLQHLEENIICDFMNLLIKKMSDRNIKLLPLEKKERRGKSNFLSFYNPSELERISLQYYSKGYNKLLIFLGSAYVPNEYQDEGFILNNPLKEEDWLDILLREEMVRSMATAGRHHAIKESGGIVTPSMHGGRKNNKAKKKKKSKNTKKRKKRKATKKRK
tara:strand:- start:1989 stop:3314 length:1326 start_codon:yes stop_codon:yes gene_type:complete